MHGISCVLSVISVCDNNQNFIIELSIAAIARRVLRWTRNLRMVIGEASKPLAFGDCIYYNSF